MTIQLIQTRLEQIRALAMRRDHEAAHAADDQLRDEVLDAIAHGTCESPAMAASLALQTNTLPFFHGYAPVVA